MFKLNAKFDADSLLYSLNHFECDSHTVHTLTQWRLPPPLTRTVKASLFTHAHSSPLSLAARLHQYHTNHSHSNNSWTFSGQTLYIYFYFLFFIVFFHYHLSPLFSLPPPPIPSPGNHHTFLMCRRILLIKLNVCHEMIKVENCCSSLIGLKEREKVGELFF